MSWKKTLSKNFIFEDGAYYEIGFLSLMSGNFIHQGIKQYNNGFFDDNGYFLKPFPSHCKKIKLSLPVIR